MATSSKNVMTYSGSNFMRQRLILATLTGKPVKIKNIRAKEEVPGVKEYEASLIRLVDKLTNGSLIEVNETGTSLYYEPGLLYGGKIEHDCSMQRSLGYYLEAVVCLAPFCKKPLDLTLHGVTNDQMDPSVDIIRNTTIPVMKHLLGTDEGLELKIMSRGMPPGGRGEVHFKCPVRQKLRPVQLLDTGKIKRIRGVAYTVRVSPSISNRLVEAAKGVLLQFLPDVYIYTDQYKGKQAGKSPGFGLSLVAETTKGAFLAAESSSNPPGSGKGPSIPEDVGKEAAMLLLEEVYRGGYVDSNNQSLACLFMALGQTDVSKLLTGPLSPYTMSFLRHMKDFLQVMFKLEVQKTNEEENNLQLGTDKVLLTCVGIGFTNLSKKVS